MSVLLPAHFSRDVALVRLYHNHFNELRHYLARKLDCPEAGRDAAQDVFLRLLVKPPVAPIHNPRGFLFQTAKNFAIDLLRAGNSRPLLVPIEDHQGTLLDPVSDPARIIEARQRLHALASGIEALPPKCRSVFFLHRFEGLTQDEIAGRVGISAKMVEKHLARAMLHLRRQWTH